jgi:hypothetical protein
MEIEIKTRSAKKREFVQAIMPSMLDQLKIASSKKMLVVQIDSDCEQAGVTYDYGIVYLIKINGKQTMKEIGLTLAHELVHVKQMIRGQLKTTKNSILWVGKPYKKNMEYLEMPWEVEAFSRQELILRKSVIGT